MSFNTVGALYGGECTCENCNCGCKSKISGGGCGCENCNGGCQSKISGGGCGCGLNLTGGARRLSKEGGTKQKNIDGKKSKKIAGVDRVVHQTKKGKKFVIRVNKKTGKRYQEYIKDLRKTKKNKPSKKSVKKSGKKSSKKSGKK